MTSGQISTGNIQGNGIAVGTGASVTIYGGIHYYPITLKAPLREAFDPLIENRVRLFGGRERILDQLMQRVRNPAGAYIVITAPAGFGKSALMAALVHLTPDAFAYHFFTPLYGSDILSESFFLRNVVEQMAEWHHYQAELPTELDRLRSLYHDLLDRPLDRVAILIIDGLDEVTHWPLAPYLSRSLPENLHYLVTVRDVGQDWMLEYQLPAKQVIHLPLVGLDRDEIALVLRTAQERGATLADNQRTLEAVYQAASYAEDPSLGADPFYVRLLAEDIAEGKPSPTNIGDRPRGLDSYLDQWWQAIRQLAGDESTRDLFGTLAAVMGPISRVDLEAINPSLVNDWSTDYFDSVLRQVRRFVVSDQSHGYTLVHPRLRQYLGQKIKIEPYTQRLIAYCAEWEQHESRYAIAYYTQHLEKAGQIADLIAVVRNRRYLITKSVTVGVAAAESDLQLAQKYVPHDAILAGLRDFVHELYLVDEKTRNFVGREYVFRAIDRFLNENPSGYFVIEASPGMGKSAILAEYVHRTSCLTHFNVRSLGITTASQFLRSVCAQIIFYAALPYNSVPEDVTRDGTFLLQLLHEAATTLPAGDRLVIAIDALDEVDLTDHPPGANLLFLPPILPDGIYFIMTRRGGMTPLAIQAPQIVFDMNAYPAENRRDVEAYLQNAAQRPDLRTWIDGQGLSELAFVNQMADLAEDDFMYLRYMLPEIEHGAYHNLSVDWLPRGLGNYYEDHWRRLGLTASSLPQEKIRIIYVLCEVREPVSRKLLSKFADVDEVTVQQVINEWKPFLHEHATAEGNRYSKPKLLVDFLDR